MSSVLAVPALTLAAEALTVAACLPLKRVPSRGGSLVAQDALLLGVNRNVRVCCVLRVCAQFNLFVQI